jgi:hypothetical protein
MNNIQNITTFDTRYMGNAPGKTPKGKPSKEIFFLLSLQENNYELQQQ